MYRTLLRYVLVEQTIPFLASLLVLTLVLFSAKIMSHLHLIFTSGSSFTDLGKMLIYLTPYFFVYTLPMATLLGVLIAFARLSHDNEITAMKSAGIGFYQMILPVSLVAVSTWVMSLALTHFVLPGGNTAFKKVLLDMARSTAQLTLKERLFNDQIAGMVFLINRISPDGRHLYDIFISDERDPQKKSTIMAEEGFLLYNPGHEGYNLRLLRGTILTLADETRSAQTIKFEKYDFNVDLSSIFGRKEFRKKERHLTFTELRQALASTKPRSIKHNKLLLEWYRRFSLPFACIVLAFVAAPLGVQAGTSSRLTGVVLGLFLFLFYYALVSTAKALGENGLFPPAVGMWLPNLLLGIVAVIMWVQTARESPFRPVLMVKQLAASVTSRFSSR
jgi:lipopolysaccharide export system permease protein